MLSSKVLDFILAILLLFSLKIGSPLSRVALNKLFPIGSSPLFEINFAIAICPTANLAPSWTIVITPFSSISKSPNALLLIPSKSSLSCIAPFDPFWSIWVFICINFAPAPSLLLASEFLLTSILSSVSANVASPSISTYNLEVNGSLSSSFVKTKFPSTLIEAVILVLLLFELIAFTIAFKSAGLFIVIVSVPPLSLNTIW